VTGNSNTFTITCGIGKQQGDALLKIMNKILANQLDPDAVMAKLDEIQKGVEKIREASAQRHLTPAQKTALLERLKSLPKPRLIFRLENGTAEVAAFADDFVEVFMQLGWLDRKRDWAMGIGASRAAGLNMVIRSKEEYPPAADALYDALRSMGFELKVFTDLGRQPNEILFLVSSKA
jgi:hypothetical protein